MREKSFVVVAIPPRRDALRGATKQSDKLLKSLKARLLRYALYTMRCPEPYRFRAVQGYARNDLFVSFSANCYIVLIRKLPLPSRERGGVRGMKTESLEIPKFNHLPPCPPPIEGKEKSGVSGWIIRFFLKGKREVDFKAEEAMKIAKSLSFPRLVGSPGEEKAASLIEKKLIDAGYHPQREEFMIPLTPWTMMKGFVFFGYPNFHFGQGTFHFFLHELRHLHAVDGCFPGILPFFLDEVWGSGIPLSMA